MPAPDWSAPVRFVEVDTQNVVFNAHYLTWCDEALNAFLAQRSTASLDLSHFSTLIRLVTTTLTWKRSAVWGDVVDVEVACRGVGRTSLTFDFEIRVGDEVCCSVATVYVLVPGSTGVPDGTGGRPAAVPDDVRAALGH